jgi:septal ring factor EnvC (AmiA/AmiB activator)
MLFDLFDRLFPEDDPKSTRKWRNTVGFLVFVMVVMLTGLTMAATEVGLPLAGQLAWAEDVDTKVQQAVKPIEDKLEKVESAVEKQADSTNAVLAKLASDQIDALVKRRCKAQNSAAQDPDEIEYLSKEIRKYAIQYRDLAKDDRYRVPTCDEVGYKAKLENTP